MPEQVQVKGPLPDTEEADPALHRFTFGAEATAMPLALPQAPFTGCGAKEAEQDAVVPPPLPKQDQLQGPWPETVDAVPLLQRFVGVELKDLALEEPQAPLTKGK